MFVDYVKGGKQKMFDTVALHMLRQNAKSRNENNCLYRGPYGLKCAVGCLIDDSEYVDTLEHKTPTNDQFINVFPKLRDTKFISFEQREERLNMLRSLQYIHDEYAVEYWVEKLKEFARNNKLRVTAINKFLKENAQ